MDMRGSKTEQNLLKAFAGESQARNRYTFFASKAKKEGFEQIGAIFEETAGNEKEHAEIFFKFLEGGPAEITATYPAGKIGSTAENLLAAAEGEKEGFEDVAYSFREISEIEEQHELRYRKLLANVQNHKVFNSDRVVKWHCRNCGYVHEGTEAPKECPACKHPRAYYELFVEAY
jgi:rubrerythrin